MVLLIRLFANALCFSQSGLFHSPYVPLRPATRHKETDLNLIVEQF